jgi:hypothetical protein
LEPEPVVPELPDAPDAPDPPEEPDAPEPMVPELPDVPAPPLAPEVSVGRRSHPASDKVNRAAATSTIFEVWNLSFIVSFLSIKS